MLFFQILGVTSAVAFAFVFALLALLLPLVATIRAVSWKVALWHYPVLAILSALAIWQPFAYGWING